MEEKNVSKKKKKSVVVNHYKPNGGEIHKRLYKAALTGDVKKLNHQIQEVWGDQVSNDELEDSVFKVYTELKLNNIRLEEEVELLLHKYLMRRVFFSKISTSGLTKTNDIKSCVKFLADLLDFVKFFTDENEVFIFCLKCIVKEIHQLKQMLISTYDALPWEEMEFYLFCYIISCTEQHDLNVFHHFILKKPNLIKYLEVFAIALGKVQVEDGSELLKLPDLKRDEAVRKIIGKYPDLKGLYEDFETIRDTHSLHKISKYAELLKSVQLQEIKGKQFIIRIVQVISQNLKYDITSPKLTNITADLLLLSVREDSRRALLDFRNSVSWEEAFNYKKRLMDNSDEEFLKTIHHDLMQMGQIADDLLLRHCLRLFRQHVPELVENQTLMQQIENNLPLFHYANKKCQQLSQLQCSPSSNIDKLNQILLQLNDIIANEDPRRMQLKKIADKIPFSKTPDLKLDILLTYVLNPNIEKTTFNSLINLNSDDIRDLLNILLSIQKDCIDKKYEIARLNAEVINLLRFGIDSDKWNEKFDEVTEMNQDLFLDRNKTQKDRLDYDGVKKEALQELKSISNKITYAKLKNDNKFLEIMKSLVLDVVFIENKDLKQRSVLVDYLETDYELNDLIFNSNMAVFHIANTMSDNSKHINNPMNNEKVSKCKSSFSDQFFIVLKKQKVLSKLAEGDFEAFKLFLENGVEIRTKDVEKSTYLHLAAEKSNISLIEYLCDKGLGVSCKNVRLQTPLHLAATNGNLEVVSYFAGRNNDVLHWQDSFGRTVLHTAVLNQHPQIIKALVNAGSNLFTPDHLGLTAPLFAVLNNNKDILVSLLQNTNSNDINKQDQDELNILFHSAIKRNSVDIIEFLLFEKYITLDTENGTSAVLSAVTEGQLDVLEVLLRYGANPANCILAAVEKNLDLVVEKLLQSKRDEANASSPTDRMTALHYAAKNGNLSIIDILLRHGADVNSKNMENYTPLHFAVRNGHLEAVKALLKNKEINMNALDSNRYTPLHIAVEIGRLDIVKTMLDEKWGLIDINSNDTISLLQLANKEGHVEIAQLLVDSGASKSYKTKPETALLPLPKPNINNFNTTFRSEIRQPRDKNPKIMLTQKTLENLSVIISGIETEYYKCSNDEIINRIIEQNEMKKSVRKNAEIKLKYLNVDKCNIVMEIKEALYNDFMNRKNLNIGWNSCSISDYFHIYRCFKCTGYNHAQTECENEEICNRCSEKHCSKDCKSTDFRCIHCVEKNKSLGLKLDVNHSPLDQRCNWYKKLLKDKYEKQRQVYRPK
ncbi:uncharacterized protein LOC123679068 [Harmonia axyridis]|uniref:uncharacterized protein LOC123679068 n=1 Tax=Harmonia axyridis TaxID=115357 RepID=UPI001E275C41|nr:uncharacterized protein LOC123679068 [Harmonia axyridis]